MLLKDLLNVLHHDDICIKTVVHYNNNHCCYKSIYTGSCNYGRYFEFDGPYGSYIVNDIFLCHRTVVIYVSKC